MQSPLTLSRHRRRTTRGQRAAAGGVLAGAALAALATVGLGAVATLRVEVSGPSMSPTLEPGDRLVAIRVPRWWPVREGRLVVVRSPQSGSSHSGWSHSGSPQSEAPDSEPPGERLMVKRLHRVGPGWVEVRGDNPASSTDSRTLGPLPRRSVVGVVTRRYAALGGERGLGPVA